MAPLRACNADQRLLCTAKSREANAPVSDLAAPDQADNSQKHDGANGRVDNRAEESGEWHDPQRRHQPYADECTDDANDDVPEQPKTEAPHDLTGQPSRDGADHNHNNNAVDSDHVRLPDTDDSGRPRTEKIRAPAVTCQRARPRVEHFL